MKQCPALIILTLACATVDGMEKDKPEIKRQATIKGALEKLQRSATQVRFLNKMTTGESQPLRSTNNLSKNHTAASNTPFKKNDQFKFEKRISQISNLDNWVKLVEQKKANQEIVIQPETSTSDDEQTSKNPRKKISKNIALLQEQLEDRKQKLLALWATPNNERTIEWYDAEEALLVCIEQIKAGIQAAKKKTQEIDEYLGSRQASISQLASGIKIWDKSMQETKSILDELNKK